MASRTYQVGDVLDNFGEEWTVKKIDRTGRKISVERQERADAFGRMRTIHDTMHPRDLDHMRLVSSRTTSRDTSRGYRVFYLGDRARRIQAAGEYTREQAITELRRLKRRGLTVWVGDAEGNFVPVPGATRKPAESADRDPRRGVKRVDLDEARQLVREATRSRGQLTQAEAGRLYEKLARAKRRIEGNGDPRSIQLSRQITHVLSRYVGPAYRREQFRRAGGHATKLDQRIAGRTPSRDPAEKSYKDMAQRRVNAEERFLDYAQKRGGLTRAQAERAFAAYRKAKVIHLDIATGQFTFKHGAFGDRDVLRRAAGV